MNKYNEAMDKIKVDKEMHDRVMAAVKSRRKRPAPLYMRAMPFAACLVVALAAVIIVPKLMNDGIGVSGENTDSSDPDVTVDASVDGSGEADDALGGKVDIMFAPEECASAEELSQSIGFEFTDPTSLPFEVESAEYYNLFNEIAEATYSGGDMTACYRKSVGTEDNSGDFEEYPDVVTEEMNGRSVTLKGTDGEYVLAIWTDGEYSYSMRMSQGLDAEQWRGILG